MRNSASYRIADLPDCPAGDWRVDWLGHVEVGKFGLISQRQNLIAFAASPKVSSGPRYGTRYDTSQAKLFKTSLKKLDSLIAGRSLPSATERPCGVLETFCVSIQPERTSIAFASEVLPVDRPLDAAASFKLLPEMRTTRVLLLDPPKDARCARIIIPCSEVFRVFYGGCESFVTAVLNGDYLVGTNHYAHQKFNGLTYRRLTTLDVAASTSYAEEQTADVSRAALASFYREGLRAITAMPPFTGNVVLMVRGIRIRSGSAIDFLVNEIVSVIAP